MELTIINTNYDGAYYTVKYKYWTSGECACTAKKIERRFTKNPSKDELIKAI